MPAWKVKYILGKHPNSQFLNYWSVSIPLDIDPLRSFLNFIYSLAPGGYPGLLPLEEFAHCSREVSFLNKRLAIVVRQTL